jgi:hypothetical protein
VLKGFEGVFAEVKGLSYGRRHDHQINLKEGSQPESVRAYRYPYYQKHKKEKIVLGVAGICCN